MTPKYAPKQSYPVTNDIYINEKLTKQASSGSTYFMIESSVGTLVCFDESIADRLEKSDGVCYNLSLKDPKPGFKYKTIMYLQGSTQKQRPAPIAPPVPQATERPTNASDKVGVSPQRGYEKAYMGPADKTHVFEEKDLRISKLSILSTVTNMMSAKLQSDPEYAKKDMGALVLEAVEYANIVTQEFIYGATKPSTSLPASAAPQSKPVEITDEPAFTDPPKDPKVQTYMMPAEQPRPVTTTYTAPQPVSMPTPPVAPPAPVIHSQPAPAPQPAVQGAAPVAAPAGQNGAAQPSGVVKHQEASKLFGSGSVDLEARMAERLRALTSQAKR